MIDTNSKDGLWMRLAALVCWTGISMGTIAETIHPAKLSSTELTGHAFKNPATIVTETPTGKIHDLTSLKSSDGKFASGMYSAGKSRFDITEPYGVDEFMFLLEGSATLTSDDGRQMSVNEV